MHHASSDLFHPINGLTKENLDLFSLAPGRVPGIGENVIILPGASTAFANLRQALPPKQ